MREWDNLTAKQRKVAELLALGDPETFETYTKMEVCELTGTPRSTLYEWLKKEEFNNYVEYLCDQSVKHKLAAYDKQLDKLIFSEKPSVKALELAYKRLGKLKEAIKLDATMQENKDISEKSLDELQAQIEELKRQAESGG